MQSGNDIKCRYRQPVWNCKANKVRSNSYLDRASSSPYNIHTPSKRVYNGIGASVNTCSVDTIHLNILTVIGICQDNTAVFNPDSRNSVIIIHSIHLAVGIILHDILEKFPRLSFFICFESSSWYKKGRVIV